MHIKVLDVDAVCRLAVVVVKKSQLAMAEQYLARSLVLKV